TLTLLLLGLALLLIDAKSRIGRNLSQPLSIVSAMFATLALIGYVYGVNSLYHIGPYSSVALHTAVTALVLSAGVTVARPERGLAAVVLGDTVGGYMARRMFPAQVGMLFALGWVRIAGQDAGLYEWRFGTALMALGGMSVSAMLICWNAWSIHKIDIERR